MPPPSVFRDSDSKWNGVQAAPSRHRGIRDGLNGWSAEPCFQCLHTGNTPWPRVRKKCLKIQQSFSELRKVKKKLWVKTRHCWQKHISLWWLFGQMLPDLIWHSLSPLASEASEAGNRISPQAQPWRTSLMTLPLTPGMHKRLKIARPQWKSKVIIFTSTSGYVYRPLSHQWLKPGQLKQQDYYFYFYVH